MRVTRLLVGHETLRGRQHHESQTSEYARNLIRGHIVAQSRFAHPLETQNRRLSVGILQLNSQSPLRCVFELRKSPDEILIEQKLRERSLHVGSRNIDAFMLGLNGVA